MPLPWWHPIPALLYDSQHSSPIEAEVGAIAALREHVYKFEANVAVSLSDLHFKARLSATATGFLVRRDYES